MNIERIKGEVHGWWYNHLGRYNATLCGLRYRGNESGTMFPNYRESCKPITCKNCKKADG